MCWQQRSRLRPRCSPGLAATALLVGILLTAVSQGARAEELRIFDTHSHSGRGQNLEDVIARMNASGVRKIILFPRRQGTDEEVLQLQAKYPERVVPTVGFQNPGWLRQEPRFLDEVEAKLKSGKFPWMGELLLKHYSVPELGAPSFDISPDNDLFRRVLDLSARYGVPVTIHHEAEPGNLETFRRALGHNPKALVVWAHWCGRSTPQIARDFLKQFPNLSCDLGAFFTGPRYGREKNPLMGAGGAFVAEWKALIEEFPDRFLAAVDAVEPVHYERLYGPAVRQLKGALAGLSPQVARKVAFENAERLLTLAQQASPARSAEAQPPTPTPVPISPATLPIINAHEHLPIQVTPEEMISIMDELGVSKVILMGGGTGGERLTGMTLQQLNQYTLKAYEKYPDRVIPFLFLNPLSSENINPQLLRYLDRELATGKFRGMGEFMGRHQALQTTSPGGAPLSARERVIPLDSPGAQDFFCLAAKYNVVLNIHMTGATPEDVARLERALQRNPTTKVIWAHQHPGPGRGDPDLLARLMEKYVNLYAEISPAILRPSQFPRELPDKWKSLYERYNDRFAVGLDNPFLPWWREKPGRIREAATLIRAWLSQLTPETQRKFASENIERILAAKPTSAKTCEFMTKEAPAGREGPPRMPRAPR